MTLGEKLHGRLEANGKTNPRDEKNLEEEPEKKLNNSDKKQE